MITNKQIIDQINKATSNKKPLLYLTRQAERGRGLEELLTHYKIISPVPVRDTLEIIEKTSFPRTSIIVFKNNGKIQKLSKEKKLKLLNPDYSLVDKYENKISQYQWLKTIIPKNLLKTIITLPAKSSFNELKKEIGSPFICQFNRSHTGEGTVLISRQDQWREMMEKFPFREVKCAVFIKKPVVTVNVCLWQDCVLTGNPSYQITGLKELTDFEFSTVGNDWSLAKKILGVNDLKKIKNLSEIIGQAMIKDGWRGLFGLDLIKDKNWLVIEINARQPASTGLETLLQRNQGKGLTILACHFAALLNLPLPGSNLEMQRSLQKIQSGSQIIIRKKNVQNRIKLQKTFYNTFKQNVSEERKTGSGPKVKIVKTDLKNKKLNSELFRVQIFNRGLMKNNGRLNDFGKKIIKALKPH